MHQTFRVVESGSRHWPQLAGCTSVFEERVPSPTSPTVLAPCLGIGEEGRPARLLCSRNARPEKGLVGRAQSETKRAIH